MRKNTGSQVIGAQLVNATTGAAFTGAVTVYVTGNGGVQAVGSVGAGACVHEGNGFHTYAPAQAETNYDHIAFTFIGTGAIPATVQVYSSTEVVTAGIAQAGAAASITLASGASSVNGTYDPALVRITGGTGSGQARLIIQYDGATRVASVDRDWRVVPDATTEYQIVASANLMSTNEGLVQAGGASMVTLNASASAVDNTYTGQTVVLRTGTGQDQSRIVASYVGATKVATVALPWETQPVAGTGYMMLPFGRASVVLMAPGVLTEAAIAADAFTAAKFAADVTTELQAGLATAANLALVKTKTDFLPSATAGAAGGVFIAGANAATSITTALTANIVGDLSGSVGSVTGAVGSVTGNVGGSVASVVGAVGSVTGLTKDTIADQVWDEILSGHTVIGSTGAALSAAGGSGDPWSTALPGAYGAGTAGNIVGAIKAKTDALPIDPADASDIAASFATVNGTLATIAGYVDTEVAAVLAAVDTEVAAIKAKTDNLPAAPAAVSNIPTALENADALLNRDMATGTDSGSPTVRTVRQALRFLRNKWSIGGTTLTVTKEDDVTASWTSTVSTTVGAAPVTGNDPA